MKNFQLILLGCFCILAVACQNGNKETSQVADADKSRYLFDLPDSLSARRVSFVLNLREAVAELCWPDFAEKRTEGTLIYFNENQSEVFFPSSRVLNSLEDYKVYSDDYVVVSRTDSIPFHFEVMISFNTSDTAKFYFDHPVEQFLSVEETGNYIPSVKSTEMWSTMVIHEMFHHFQYNTPDFKEYAKSQIGTLPFSSIDLVELCREDEQFLTLIQKENDNLLSAIAEENEGVRDSLIFTYLEKRSNRVQKYSEKLPHLEQVENYYIIQEGSARYIEYQSMLVLNTLASRSQAPTILDDPKFNSYTEFDEIDFSNDEFNYLIYAGATDYHYALGFNIMRLLDELNIDYKRELLALPEKALHEYLEGYLNTLPNNSYKH